MKKLLSLLLAFLMICSLCSCGVLELWALVKNSGSSPSATREANKVETIIDGTPFSDGVAVVAHHAQRSDTRFSVIDKEGNILGDFDFQDFNLFHNGMYYYLNGVLLYGDNLYDKTGTLIASPETTGYTRLLTDARCDGKLLAVKIEQTPSGETLYFGVLNNKGNWIEPLSDTHPIATTLKKNNLDSFSLCRNQFSSDEVVIVAENCYYNIKTGAVTERIEEYYGTRTDTYESILHEVYKIDSYGNRTKIKDGVYMSYSLPTGFIGGYTQSDDTYVNLYYFDENGNERINLNTEYIIEAKVIDGYLFILCDREQGGYRFSVYKTSGEILIESLDESPNLSELRVWPEYDLFSFEQRHIYNFNGEKIEFEEYAISWFGEGLFYTSHKEDYHRAYLDINGNRVL